MGILKNKVAIVTGAAGGLGEAIARAYADEGANVVVSVNNSKGNGEKIVDKINKAGKSKAVLVVTDVTSEDSVASTVEKTVQRFGKLDILVNCSGIIMRKSLLDHSLEDWEKVMSVDLTGTFLTGKYAAKQMIKQNSGKIINVASIAGLIGYDYVSYSASKAGVINLTRTMASELGPYGINVNSICPGLVITNINRAVVEGNKELYDKSVKKIPSRKLGLPIDIAQSAVFLASEKSNYINGVALTVDGGAICHFNYYGD